MKKNTRLFLLVVTLMAIFALTMVFASAKTIEVPAGGDLVTAVAEAEAGDVIQITGDVTCTGGIVINKDLTIQGTGTVTFTGKTEVDGETEVFKPVELAILISSSAKVTIGTLGDNSLSFIAPDGQLVMRFNEKSKVTINGGTFYGTINGAKGSGYGYDGNACLEINGGVFSAKENSNVLNFNSSHTTITINGGEFTSHGSALTLRHWDGLARVEVYGGTFTNTGSGYAYWCANTYGGVIGNLGEEGPIFRNTGTGAVICNASGGNGELTINSGTFESASGYTVFVNAAKKVTINGGNFSSTKGTVVCVNDSGCALNIQGGTFTADGDTDLVLKNNGILDIYGGTFTHNGKGNIIKGGAGKTAGALTVNGENATFVHNGTGDVINNEASFPIYVSNVSFAATGSNRFITIVKGRTVNFELCVLSGMVTPVYASRSSGVIVTCVDSIFASIREAAVNLNGATLKGPEGNLFRDAAGFTSTQGTWTPAGFKIGNTVYGSIGSAAAAVKDGETITVLADISGTVSLMVDKTYTLEVNGFRWDGSLIVTKGHVTVKNAKFYATATAVSVQNIAASVTLEDSLIYFLDSDKNAGVELAVGATSDGMGLEDYRKLANVTVKNTDIYCVYGFTDGEPTMEDGKIIIGKKGIACVNMAAGGGRIDALSGKMYGAAAWFHIIPVGLFNIGEEGPQSDALYCREAGTRAIWLRNGSFKGEVNVRNGNFSLSRSDAATIYVNAAGATLNVSGGVFDGFIDIFSMHDGDCVSPVNISGGTFNMIGGASVVNFRCAPSASESNNILEKAGHLTISGGTFNTDKDCFGDLIHVSSTKELGTVTISGGTFNGNATRILYAKNTPVKINVTGGTFKGYGTRLVYIYGRNDITISGGTFILEEIPAGVDQLPSNDDCAVNISGSAKNYVRIAGGNFINKRSTALANVLVQSDEAVVWVDGGTFYTVNKNGNFIMDARNVDRNNPVDANKKAQYEGSEYYVLTTKAATSLYAPSIGMKPSLRSYLEQDEETKKYWVSAQGIRFSAYIPASAVAALSEMGTVSYGTLIIPNDVFTKLTAYSDYHKTLATLAAGKDAAKIYADVVATEKGMTKDSEGNINFYASLINIKEENYNKKFIGIAYAKVTAANGTSSYYYSGIMDGSASSMVDVVTRAMNDVKEYYEIIGGKHYAYYNIYDGSKTYSRYSKTEQYTFEKYLGQ